jgi:dTDP-4-dehydrorhamnose reductase
MEKILLTGAGGFLASRFFSHFKDKFIVIPLKRQECDITDENKVISVMKEIRPSYVLHTAAIADTGKCEENKEASYAVNVLGSMNITKACNLTGAKMLHLSTEQIYNGNIEAGPYGEDTIPKPNTTYGIHKLQAEKEIGNILEEAWILRLTWLFSFPERNKKVNSNIVWNVVSASLKGKTLNIPVNEFRGMTYVYDLLDNLPKIVEIPYGIYNTGSENNLSTFDIAQLIVKEMGLKYRQEEIINKDMERYKDVPRDIRISNQKLRSYGIEFMDTEEAVKKCINDFGVRF